MSAGGASVGVLVSQGAGKITLTARFCGARSVLGAVGAAGSAVAAIVIINSAKGAARARINFMNASLFDATTSCQEEGSAPVVESGNKSGTSGKWQCSLHAHTEGLFMRRKR